MNIKYSEVNKLKNGMDYYVYDNFEEHSLNDYIRLTLVVKVGSMMEEDNQCGIAHFIEHMSIYNSHGINGEGKEINNNNLISGYTNFEETVYRLNCTIESLENCLICLKEILYGENLNKSSMDAIKNELNFEINNVSKTSSYKLQKKILPNITSIKNISDKLPLGKLSCVDKLMFEDVKDFHNKWYKYNNSAIFIVGKVKNVNISDLLNKVFNKVIDGELCEKRVAYSSDLVSKKKIVNIVDNLAEDSIQLYYLKTNMNIKIKNFNYKIINYFCLTLIQEYISEAFLKEKIDFISLDFVSANLFRRLRFNVLELKTKEKLLDKSQYLLNIITELKKNGLKKEKFELYKKQFLTELIDIRDKDNRCDIRSVAKRLINSYLYDEVFLPIIHEYNLLVNIVKEVNYKDFNFYIKNILQDNKLIISFNIRSKLSEHECKILETFNNGNNIKFT